MGRILLQSRRNNAHASIGGVLYFGDGYFFQALEGERQAVNQAYQRIAADARHTDVTILSLKTISERFFADWSMKYVPAEEAVRQFIRSRNFRRFEPLAFQEADAEALTELFHHFGDARGKPKKSRGGWFGWRRLFPER